MTTKIQLLGGFDLRGDQNSVAVLPSGKARAPFACLAMAPGQRQSRLSLAALLWDGSSDPQARGNLRFTLAVLRKALNRACCGILGADKEFVWLRARSVFVDALEFERLVNSAVAADVFKALDLHRGEFLDGLSVRSEPFEDWLRAQRLHCRDLLATALDKLISRLDLIDDENEVARIASRLLTFDPAREEVHRILIALYRRQGRVGDALRQYNNCADLLKRELGVEPGLETRRLIEEVRGGHSTARAQISALNRHSHLSQAASMPGICSVLIVPFRFKPQTIQAQRAAVIIREGLEFALSRFKEIRVTIWFASRHAYFQGNALPAGIDFVVDCDLTWREASFEASARLLDAQMDCFWSRTFRSRTGAGQIDRKIPVQEFAAAVCRALEQRQLKRLQNTSLSLLPSFPLALLARAHLAEMTKSSLEKAVALARRAQRMEPTNSLAFSILALARGFQVRMGWAAKAGDALAEAKDAAAEGVCLDYDDPIAHGAFGIVHWMSGSHDLALRSIDRALALNPNRADLIHWKGLILDFTGDHEMAIHYHESALRLDPHHRASFATVNAFSGAYYELGDYQKAATWARKSISMNPQYRRGHAVLAASLAQIGDEKGAAAALQTVFRLDPTFTLRTQLSGLIYKNTREVIAWEQGYKKAGLR